MASWLLCCLLSASPARSADPSPPPTRDARAPEDRISVVREPSFEGVVDPKERPRVPPGWGVLRSSAPVPAPPLFARPMTDAELTAFWLMRVEGPPPKRPRRKP